MRNVFFYNGNIPLVFYGNIFFLLILTIKLSKNHLNEVSRKKRSEGEKYSHTKSFFQGHERLALFLHCCFAL